MANENKDITSVETHNPITKGKDSKTSRNVFVIVLLMIGGVFLLCCCCCLSIMVLASDETFAESFCESYQEEERITRDDPFFDYCEDYI